MGPRILAANQGIPVVLGNAVGCPWITQYDFWRELFYFHKYVGVSNTFALYTATKRSAELSGIGDETGRFLEHPKVKRKKKVERELDKFLV